MTDFLVTVVDAVGQMHDLRIGSDDALIGRMRSCTIRLAGWRIGRAHARIVRMATGLVIEDLGTLAARGSTAHASCATDR
jgi:pilus assembly protein CpaF